MLIHPLSKKSVPSKHQKFWLGVFYFFASIIYLPLKLIITFASLSFATLLALIVNANTDPKQPIPPKRYCLRKFGQALTGKLLCIGHGLFIKEVNPQARDKSADVVVGNHCSYLDALVMLDKSGGSAIVNQGMADFWFLRSLLKVSRAIVVQRPALGSDSESVKKKRAKTARDFGIDDQGSITQMMQKRVNERNNGVDWPQIIIFPEGTISNSEALLRFRTSVFALDGCKIQPFSLKYHTVFNLQWLTCSGLQAMFRSFLNPFGYIEVEWLEPQIRGENQYAQEFADQVGITIANNLGGVYTKYKNDDISYFLGWKPIEKCGEEYIKDFGALGTFADVKMKLGKGKRYELVHADVQTLLSENQSQKEENVEVNGGVIVEEVLS
ncbi:Lysophospholipid_acyltransferase [Hexamita inflata]|uniref:Lysophospholipid_acyltransferase n=1 Tax=Hexamita inflata TaxID=28002 RepID=A0ABP1HPF6_9EUKA